MTLYDVLRAWVSEDRAVLNHPDFAGRALAAIDAHEAASAPRSAPPPAPSPPAPSATAS